MESHQKKKNKTTFRGESKDKFSKFPNNTSVLVLAGLQSILFLVAGKVPCFGFKIKIMLTHRWLSCCRADYRTRTGDLKWPKGCSTPSGHMWNNKVG